MKQHWEYQVEQFGSALKAARSEEVESFLNGAAAEGWELSQVAPMSNGSKIMVILQRRLLEQRRRRKHTWP
jgi:hypothetical protein